MHRTALLSITLASAFVAEPLAAQEVQWLTASPASWLQNPTTPVDVLCARDPDHVYVARLDSISYTYNQPMGSVTLSRQAADGSVLWSVDLGDTVQVESIASDEDGNVVLGGRYFRRLLEDGVPVLTVPEGHVSEGSFVCAWDANGASLWHQDVSGSPFDDLQVSSIALDEQGRFWVALNDFFNATIARLDANGAQVESRTLVDSKTIGSISFDPWGGLYVSGAAVSPDITVNGTQFSIPHDYALFVTRMNAAGEAQWVRSAEDITFQKPMVQADQGGHAYLAGSYFVPLTWGSIPFADPLWSTGTFITRLDSLGNFDWGLSPSYAPGSGLFTLGRGKALGVDGEGNAYVLGNQGGALDWGNNVVTGSGTISDNSTVLLSFDATGLPRWGLQGGSTFTDIMYDVAVASDGVAHLVGITSDPFTLGPFTVDPINERGTVVARVDPEMSTGLSGMAVGVWDAIAQPSVFTHGFRLVDPSMANAPNTSVLVMDATGRVVERANGLGEELGRRLAPGTYTVIARAGARVLRTRVVKQ